MKNMTYVSHKENQKCGQLKKGSKQKTSKHVEAHITAGFKPSWRKKYHPQNMMPCG